MKKMSSEFKVLSSALVALMALVFYSAATKADVTGSFGIHLSLNPIKCYNFVVFDIVGFPDQPCEKTFWKIDFETDININVAISGLTMGIHSHTGVTGFEDIILSFATTLGMLDIKDMFVFAQPFKTVILPDGEAIPTCLVQTPGGDSCLTLFVKKRVETTISWGGVTFHNLAIFEDVNFPSFSAIKAPGEVYNQQFQAFGFGDLLTISGQTPSGITIAVQASICVQTISNSIKKHTFSYSVNPDCAAGRQPPSTKPAFLFDFEKLLISSIPLASGLILDSEITCGTPVTGLTCSFTDTFTIIGGPIFDLIKVSSTFTSLPLGPEGTRLSDITTVASGGPLVLVIIIDPASLTIRSFSAIADFTINPKTNPARLRMSAIGSPGLSSFSANFSVQRAGLTFFANLGFDVMSATQTFNFAGLTLGLEAEAGVVAAEADIRMEDVGKEPEAAFLLGGDLRLRVAF